MESNEDAYREYMREYKRKWMLNNYKNDPNFRERVLLSRRVCRYKKLGIKYKCDYTSDIETLKDCLGLYINDSYEVKITKPTPELYKIEFKSKI